MAGLNRNFYYGNLSELLADYLLSKIGIATPVRRQFDIGMDFYCNLMDANAEYLTFGNPFAIQIKSISTPKVEFGSDDPKKWKRQNIVSIFQNQIPFFVGIVDKANTSIKIYDTSALWQLYNKVNLNFSQIILAPNFHEDGEYRNNFKETRLDAWENTEADGIQYDVDLGNPIIEFSDRDESYELGEKSKVLRMAIVLEQRNIINRNLGSRSFEEIKVNNTNHHKMIFGMNFQDNYGESYTSQIYDSIRLPLMTLSNNLINQSRTEENKCVTSLLRNIPMKEYYPQLYNQSPEHYEWMGDMIEKQKANDPKNIINSKSLPGEI